MFRKIKNNQLAMNYKRMWPFIKPFWVKALIATLITIPIGSLDAVIALSLKPYMDAVMVEKELSTPAIIPAFIILFTLFQAVLDYSSSYLNTWVGANITQSLKKKLYGKLMSFETRYFDETTSGAIVFGFDTDVNTACSGLINNVKVFTSRLFSSLSLVCVLIYTSWELAIIAVTVLVGSLYPLTRIRHKIKEITLKSVVAGAEALTIYNETYQGNKTISSYNLQNYQQNKFNGILKHIFKLTIKQVQRTAWSSPMMHIIISFGIAGVIWMGSVLILNEIITSGDFVAFLAAMLMLYNPVKNIGKNYNNVILSFMAIERVFEKMDRATAIHDKKDAIELTEVKKKVQFKDVTFEYRPGIPVLKKINLEAKIGQTIALVGNSGGGKTTAVNLIPRFYDVNEGSILIDGTDVRNFTLHSLRDNIAVVFQDNFLFSGTIRENILMGRLDATDAEVRAALKSACLDEFISELKDGLDTHIGERGSSLSGGQKQRVAIARAFLKNAPIVILDEATSALDNKSEAIVQLAIDNLMKDRTVFVIAHRLSTVQNADKIVVINEGEIVEEGLHEQLINQDGPYRALYMAQFRSGNQ